MNPFKYLIMIPFGWVLRQLYTLVGNYGVALILFSLLVKIILLPMSIKSKRSMLKMNRLSPMMNALKKKYGDDQQRYNQALVELYKAENISPTGGCLWSFLPILIMIPLYYVIRSPLTYIMGLQEDQVAEVISVLSANGVTIDTSLYYYQVTAASYVHQFYDAIRAVVPDIMDMNLNFLGIDLGATPQFMFWTSEISWATIGAFLIPFVSGASQFGMSWLSQKLNNSVATNEKGEKDASAAATANQSMKMMLYFMPLFSVYIGFTMSASISIYWIAQAVFSAAQEVFLTKYFRKSYDEEDAQKRLKVLEQEAEEAEKARLRAEKRAAGITDGTENTSKKKLQKQQKQDEQRELQEKFGTKEEKAEPTEEELKGFSGDPDRPYSRGRAYKPERYSGRSKTE